VVSAFLGFLNGGEIPKDMNKTLQVLIPKVNNPQDLYECIHYLWNKKGKTGGCDIKLGMAKAYDRVEWEYLNAIMQALGFPTSWCSLVMKCISSVSFSVRVNGVFSDNFKPTRGIRQGDPI
jgi:hypothetical protein